MTQQEAIKIGTRIEVIDNFGNGPIRQGVITEFSEYQGHFTAIYQDDEGKERWALANQILDVVSHH